MSRSHMRDRELLKTRYADKLVMESEEFNNVAYEVKDGAVNVMIFNEYGKCVHFPGRLEEIRRFAYELLDICESWREVRT